MFISKKHLPRRTFLKGAGVTLGLPLLDAMIPAATALANTAAKPAKRAGWIYFPHGAIMNNTALGLEWDNWTPRTEGRDFAFSPILKSLEPFRDHVTVVSGLGNPTGSLGPVHAVHVGTWLPTVKPPAGLTPNIGPSVDQVAARYIGQETPVPSVQVAAVAPASISDSKFGTGYGSTMSFATATQGLRPQNNITLAFQNVFGAGSTAAIRASLQHEAASVLDLMKESLASLRSGLGPVDQAVLNDYTDQVRELERRAILLEQKDLSQYGIGDPWANVGNYQEKFDTMFDLIVLAFRTDMTRIFTYLAANEGSNGSGADGALGVTFAAGWHETSHHANDPTRILSLIEQQKRLTERFAVFIGKLANTQDGDGTLLDHSAIVWGSNMGNSHNHDNSPTPQVLLGRAAGAIRGGQHVRYPANTQLANLWLTMLHRLDVPVESHGVSDGILSNI